MLFRLLRWGIWLLWQPIRFCLLIRHMLYLFGSSISAFLGLVMNLLILALLVLGYYLYQEGGPERALLSRAEKWYTKNSGAQCTIGGVSFSISLDAFCITIKDWMLKNPPGYDSECLVTIKRTEIAFHLRTIFSEVRAVEVSFYEPCAYYEVGAGGNDNITVAKQGFRFEDAKSHWMFKTMVFHRIRWEHARVQVVDKKETIRMKDKTVRDHGLDEGAAAGDALGMFLTAVLAVLNGEEEAVDDWKSIPPSSVGSQF